MSNNVGVTNRGFEYLTQYLAQGTSTNWPYPQFIGWGTANGNNSASVTQPAASNQYSDVAPYSELSEARVTGTVSTTGNTAATSTVTYQLTGTITASTGESPAESFIAMSSSKPPSTTTGAPFLPAATALTVSTVSGMPAPPFYMQALNEVVHVTSVASTVYTCTRGANGSTSYSGTVPTATTITMGNVPGAGTGNPYTADTFAHAGFQALSLNSADSIAFTWQVNVTY